MSEWFGDRAFASGRKGASLQGVRIRTGIRAKIRRVGLIPEDCYHLGVHGSPWVEMLVTSAFCWQNSMHHCSGTVEFDRLWKEEAIYVD